MFSAFFHAPTHNIELSQRFFFFFLYIFYSLHFNELAKLNFWHFKKLTKKKKDEIYALTAFLFRNLTKLYGYQEQEETEEKKLMLKEVLFFCG